MLDPKEEARFDELKAKCRELKVPAPPEIMIGLKVHDHNGILTFDDIQRGHSWTRNYWNSLCSSATGGTSLTLTFGAGLMSGKNTAGSISSGNTFGSPSGQDGYPNYSNSLVYRYDANSTNGIVVGTSDTAFSIEQYSLGTLITHGNGAGQLAYNISTHSGYGSGCPIPAYTGGTKTWETSHSRIFNNNSGGSITVKEVGIYSSGSFGLSAIMMERSVLSPTLAVADGAQLTVTYAISMDFSAID
jgi:hypothetical protein